MSSPAKTTRVSTVTAVPLLPNTSTNDRQDDFEAFRLRTVIRDFKLMAEF